MQRTAIIFVLFILSVGAYAQDLPDTIMNWCDDDGPFAGQCTIEGDEALTNYLWELGWYLAAVDRGEITASDLPDRFIKKDAPVDEETSNDDDDPKFGCDVITLPNVPGSAANVSGELVYQGATYNSVTVTSATYNTLGAGQAYDPSIIGGKYKVNILATDGAGDKVQKNTYKFKCEGDFDNTAGGLFPIP